MGRLKYIVADSVTSALFDERVVTVIIRIVEIVCVEWQNRHSFSPPWR